MDVIRDTSALARLCTRLADADFVTVDTEFIRDQTYYPRLCLIQMAGDTDEAIVDPLEKGLDLAPFYELMQAPVTKVFHAARQDFEIFFNACGQVPEPFVDTQIAAMVCGYGDSVGYETLVKAVTGSGLDKSSRFTDWSRRPLSQKQLDYAIADVTHLRAVYRMLKEMLDEKDRWHWLAEEEAVLKRPNTYRVEPEEAWRRLKMRNPKPRFLATAQALAAWREREAQTRDVPRNRILRDDALLELAAQAPKSSEECDRLRAVPKGFGRSQQGKAAVAAIAEAQKLPKEKLPKPESRGPQAQPDTALADLLRVLLKAKAEDHGVAPRLIANTSELDALAAGQRKDLVALGGWRREVFGEDALALCRGEIALAVEGGKVVPLKRDA